jgi:L-amino acid N-acyltransferase YncA
MIRPVRANDAEAIREIYNHYVANTICTFDEQLCSVEQMRCRIVTTTEAYPWFVAETEGRVVGYSCAGPWKSRCAYRHTVESTVYVAHELTGHGIGRRLYEALISDLRSRSIHNVIGGISLPNPASIALHEKLGFEKAAHFKEVGRKFERWIDVGYWELILDWPTH